MDAPVRTAQKIDVSFTKVIHLVEYEKEEFSGSLTATFNRALTPEEGAVEIAKLQAELERGVFDALYRRKLIVTHDYVKRMDVINDQLNALGAPTLPVLEPI